MKSYIVSIVLVIIIVSLGYLFYAVNDEHENRLSIPDGYESIEKFVFAQQSRIQKLLIGELKLELKEENLGAAVKPAGLFTYRLSGSGISSSATSFTLTSLTLPQNDYAIQDSDLSDTFFVTIEPGSKTKQEFVSCTTIGSNSGGSVTISGCTRGISPITPFTSSSTLQFAHSGASAVIFSDPPSLFNQYAAKSNVESITAGWIFSATSGSLPGYISTPANLSGSSTAFASVGFAQNLANQGAATATESVGGIVELATAVEAASSTDLGANIPLVLQAKNASTTPGLGEAFLVVVTQFNKKISQAFIDLTEAFSWSGLHTFSATTTFNATTTILSPGTILLNNFTVNATTTVFDASGTFTKPGNISNTTLICAKVWAGGGGGGGVGAAVTGGGGGGGGGSFVEGCFLASQLSTDTTITIGGGGAGGVGSSIGAVGGNSTFGSPSLRFEHPK